MKNQSSLTFDTKNQYKLECAVIGIFIREGTELVREWNGTLTSEDFLDETNIKLWNFMAARAIAGEMCDLIILQERLGLDITKLLERVDLDGILYNLPEYARILKRNAYKRRIIGICSEPIPVDQIADKIVILPKYEPLNAPQSILQLIDTVKEIGSSHKGTKYQFNLPVLQRKTGGFDVHETVTIGGYSSHGKTSLATHITIGLAQAGHRILFLTAEQSEIDMTRAILANLCGINTMDFRSGKYSLTMEKKVIEAEDKIKEWDYVIRRVTTTGDIYREVKKHSPDIVVIDYLQNIAPAKSGISSHQRDTDNAGMIQNMTLTEPIATILLSQLSRPPYKKMRRPTLQSFMNTSAIEQKAHIALLTWWQAKVDGKVERYNNPRGEEYDVDVAKSKMGPTGICKLNYWPEYCRFESWDNPAEQIQPWKGAKNDK